MRSILSFLGFAATSLSVFLLAGIVFVSEARADDGIVPNVVVTNCLNGCKCNASNSGCIKFTSSNCDTKCNCYLSGARWLCSAK